jgi:excisionase family DNA binding protein
MKSRNATVASLLTVDEVADYLRASHAMIYRLLRRGEIPGFKIGGDWRSMWKKSTVGARNGKVGQPAPQLRALAGRLGQHPIVNAGWNFDPLP